MKEASYRAVCPVQLPAVWLLPILPAPARAAGGASLHACMTPHGPDTKTFEGATAPEAEQVARLPRQASPAAAGTLIAYRTEAPAGPPRMDAVPHAIVRFACLPTPPLPPLCLRLPAHWCTCSPACSLLPCLFFLPACSPALQ